MDFEISKIGERGQVVIPLEFREQLKIKKGEKLIVLRSGTKLILQQMDKFKARTLEKLQEDFLDMKIAEMRMNDVAKGKVQRQTKKEFLKEMEDWIKE